MFLCRTSPTKREILWNFRNQKKNSQSQRTSSHIGKLNFASRHSKLKIMEKLYIKRLPEIERFLFSLHFFSLQRESRKKRMEEWTVARWIFIEFVINRYKFQFPSHISQQAIDFEVVFSSLLDFIFPIDYVSGIFYVIAFYAAFSRSY